MGKGLFDVLTEDELRNVLRTQAERPSVRNEKEWNLAVDCLENNQLRHVKSELKRRYPERQRLPAGEEIQPLSLPLTERYVAEAATAYSNPVMRTLVDDEGKVDEEATKQLTDMLEAVGWNELMHSLERHTVLLDTSVLLTGAKRGELTGQVITPQQIYPILPADSTESNPADQRDYMGHVVSLGKTGQGNNDPTDWVFFTPAANYYYRSLEWSEVGEYKLDLNEAWTWAQPAPTDDYRGNVKDLPLQMITYWHRYLPAGKLIPPTDSPIGGMNIELAVQWAVMLDTLRKQGWSQLVLSLVDSAKAPTTMALGSAFAICIGEDENADSLTHTNDYNGMVAVLKVLSKLFAILLRQSPNDFSIDQKGPESGFAKVVDSLPKIEFRAERIRRLTRIEERLLWPRLGAIGVYLKLLDKRVRGLKMRVHYSDIEYPQTIEERILEQDNQIKRGMTTVAKIMAKRDGIPVEEAQKIIDTNLAAGEPEPEPEPPPEVDPEVDPDDPIDKVERIVAGQTKQRRP
jgi:hypothetical protein